MELELRIPGRQAAVLQFGDPARISDRAAAGKEDRKVYPRLLAVDNELVVPVNTRPRVLVTAADDVIHSFAMPSFGIKIDAVPGRLNETWFKAEKEGLLLRPVLASSAARTMPSCRSPSASSPTRKYKQLADSGREPTCPAPTRR